jgi:rubrerythrin
MTQDYLTKLEELLRSKLEILSEQISGKSNPDAKAPPIHALLKAALKNEWETTLLTSHWVTDEEDPDFRVSLARLAGDEAKHFEIINKRLSEMGESIATDDLNQRTPLFNYLIEQKSTFDRVVTGPFCREALAVERNRVFLDYCKSQEDSETQNIYKEIQDDEDHHHQLGRKYLEKLVTSEEDFQRASDKINEVLKVVDDIQEMLVMKKGICNIPGC